MPARRWSEQDRDKVIRMVAEGESRHVIAKKLKTSVSSLRRHFGELLNHEVGQQPKEFTPQEKASAIAMASYGIAQREIADCLDVSLTCLRRHLGDDMTKAPTQANANVARALYRGATREGSTKAQIFWLKNRMPKVWGETHRGERTFDRSDGLERLWRLLYGESVPWLRISRGVR